MPLTQSLPILSSPPALAITSLLPVSGFTYSGHCIEMEFVVLHDWLLSLGIMFSRLVHTVARVRALFLFMTD